MIFRNLLYGNVSYNENSVFQVHEITKTSIQSVYKIYLREWMKAVTRITVFKLFLSMPFKWLGFSSIFVPFTINLDIFLESCVCSDKGQCCNGATVELTAIIPDFLRPWVYHYSGSISWKVMDWSNAISMDCSTLLPSISFHKKAWCIRLAHIVC